MSSSFGLALTTYIVISSMVIIYGAASAKNNFLR
jgi:hypothetical protein